MKYKQIVFDVDGTLIDNEKAILYSLQGVLLEKTGKKFPFEELIFALGIPGEDSLMQFHIENIPEAMQLWIEKLQQYGDMVSVHKGIEELLEQLSKDGYGTGIVSSRTRDMYESDFNKLSIGQYFSIAVCADDTQGHKPTADPLLKYMELSKTERHEILYIGDSIHDSQCAENAGVDFALAVWGSPEETIRADYYLKKPTDLLAVLAEN